MTPPSGDRTHATVGIIANPLAGKDIRRLVAEASPTSDMAKMGIVRRAVIGAIEGGATRVILADDRRGIGLRAIDGLDYPDVEIVVLDEPIIDSGMNSTRAARRCRDEGAGAVIVLGGDGTHRDVAKGWKTAPMVALSTGTNNVFPRQIEATVAGHAAGLVASGRVALAEAATQAKCIEVKIEDPARIRTGGGSEQPGSEQPGSTPSGPEQPEREAAIAGSGDVEDLALVDVALVSNTFTASRAVWDASTLQELVACIAEPATVGLSAIAASLAPTTRHEPGGVHLRFQHDPAAEEHQRSDESSTQPVERGPSVHHAEQSDGGNHLVRAPIAPGLYTDVGVASHRRLGFGEVVEVRGPGSLSFDGERDVTLRTGQRAMMRVMPDGPLVIDVERTMLVASMSEADSGAGGRFGASVEMPGCESSDEAKNPQEADALATAHKPTGNG